MKEIYTVEALQHALAGGLRPKYLYFWGHRPRVPGQIDKSCLSNWYPASFEVDGQAGSKHPRTAGNGSIMRLAPVALSYHKWEVEELLYRCEQSSRTTHQAEECLAACRVLGLLIAKALRATSKSEVYQMTPQELETLAIHERAPRVYAIAQGSFTRCSDDEIRGSGYVVESLQAALWAFYHSTSFREGALKAVNLGDDADTTGAVYGQIAGAFYGAEGIPDVWLQKLAWRDQLESYALQLAV